MDTKTFTFGLGWPWWIVALAVLGISMIGVMAFRRGVANPQSRVKWTLFFLRTVTLLGLIWMLLIPMGVTVRTEDGGRPVVAVLLDGSKSMTLSDGDMTKQDRASAWLKGLPSSLGQQADIKFFQFSDRLSPLVSPDSWRPTGLESDLGAALDALSQESEGMNTTGIILVSDGIHRGTVLPRDAARRFRDRALPIYVVGVGDRDTSKDVGIVVQAPERIRREENLEIQVEIKSRGWRGSVPIELRSEGRMIEQTVAALVPGASASVRFSVKPSGREGIIRYEVKAAVADETPANNTAPLLVRVEDPERPDVLLVAGAPSWEGRFMTRVFEEETKARVVILTRVIPGGSLAEQRVRVVGERPRGFPESLDELSRYKAILLVNVPPDMLTKLELERLRAFVVERGGGLAWVGGKDFLTPAWQSTPLSDALPMTFLENRSQDHLDSYHWMLSAVGRTHPIFRGTEGWDDLPALDNVALIGPAKPGGEMLAIQKEGRGYLFGVQRFGKGRTALLATDALWRWRMDLAVSDGHYERFWKQTLAWLTADASDKLDVRCSSTSVAVSEPLQVEASVYTSARVPNDNALVELSVKNEAGQIVSRQVLPRVSGAPGSFRGMWKSSAPGRYTMTVSAQDQNEMSVIERIVEVRPVELELQDAGMDEEALKEIAEVSQGRYIRCENSGAGLMKEVAAPKKTSVIVKEVRELWDHPWLWTVLAAAFALEWTVRKMSGLA